MAGRKPKFELKFKNPSAEVLSDTYDYQVRVVVHDRTQKGVARLVFTLSPDSTACLMRQCRRALGQVNREMARITALAESPLPLD